MPYWPCAGASWVTVSTVFCSCRQLPMQVFVKKVLKSVNLSSKHDLQRRIVTLWVPCEKQIRGGHVKGYSNGSAGITEKCRLWGTSCSPLIHPSAQKRADFSVALGFLQLFRKSEGWSLGLVPGLYHSLEILFSLHPNWNFQCCSLCLLSLTILLCSSEKSLVVFYVNWLLVVENSDQISPQPFLLQDAQTPLPQLLLVHHVLLALLVASAGLALIW